MSRKKNKARAQGRMPTKSALSQPSSVSTESRPRQPARAPSGIPFATLPSAFHSSLAEEARWMSSHRTSAFDAAKTLRFLPVQFVSAGHLEGTIERCLPEPDPPPYTSPQGTPDDASNAMARLSITRSPSAQSVNSSSSDEVVFRGRMPEPCPSVLQSNTISQDKQSFRRPNCLQSVLAPMLAESHAPANVNISVREREFGEIQGDVSIDSIIDSQTINRYQRRPSRDDAATGLDPESRRSIDGEDTQIIGNPIHDVVDALNEAAAMDNYQHANELQQPDGNFNELRSAHRDLDADVDSHHEWSSTSESVKEQFEIGPEYSCDSDLLLDFDDISTSTDILDKVVRIISKRTRVGGIQYLCIYEDCIVDDARWLPSTLLTGESDQSLIDAFEETLRLREDLKSDTSSAGTCEEFFDDEAIARALQEQEELGLGMNEQFPYPNDLMFANTTNIQQLRGVDKSKNGRHGRGRSHFDTCFPSASAMADALTLNPYDGFDIMDFKQPYLKPKKKGRRGVLPPELELSDEDLNRQMQRTWEADRAKKRIKKAEREELRQQGLLGRKQKGKPPNLKMKYKGGIVMEDVVEEVREFMIGSLQSLSLPPMDAPQRAAIHQAANFLNLSSRSRGAGQNRFTVLSKTTRTRIYTDEEFDHATLRKGLLRRLRGPLHSSAAPRQPRFSATGSNNHHRPHAGYHDGDTVGANAPELGPENKGHALLMKMGWSKGMGLGALDNKGILQPIPHTVKINKAGLQ